MATSTETEVLTGILVTPERHLAILSGAAEASSVLMALRDWPCDTTEDEASLAEILGAIKGRAKELEEMRTSITGPLNAAKAAVDALFKPAKTGLAEAESIIKAKLAEAHTRREAANQARLQAASASAQAGDTASAAASLAAVDRAKPAGVSFRVAWSCQIEDSTKVPREWLTVDVAAVKAHLARFNDTPLEPEPVPGLKFSKVVGVTARAG